MSSNRRTWTLAGLDRDGVYRLWFDNRYKRWEVGPWVAPPTTPPAAPDKEDPEPHGGAGQGSAKPTAQRLGLDLRRRRRRLDRSGKEGGQ
jgi:hypothetical protein